MKLILSLIATSLFCSGVMAEITAPNPADYAETYADNTIYYLYNVDAQLFFKMRTDQTPELAATTTTYLKGTTSQWEEFSGTVELLYWRDNFPSAREYTWQPMKVTSQKIGTEGALKIEDTGMNVWVLKIDEIVGYRLQMKENAEDAVSEVAYRMGTTATTAGSAIYPYLDINGSGNHTTWYFVNKEKYDARLALYNAITSAEAHSISTTDQVTIYNDQEATVAQLRQAASLLDALVSTTATAADFTKYVDYAECNRLEAWTVTGDATWELGGASGWNEWSQRFDFFSHHIKTSNETAIATSTVKQTLAGLPAGKYTLTANVLAHASDGVKASAKGSYLFANSDKTEIATFKDGYDWNNWNPNEDYSVTTYVGANGRLEFGIDVTAENTCTGISLNSLTLSYTPEFSINDTENAGSIFSTFAGKSTTVTLNRTFTTNVWNTCVLPFALTSEQLKSAFGEDVAVATFNGVTDNVVQFQDATETGANVPFAVKPSGNVNLVFSNVTLTSGTPETEKQDGYKFVGTYAPIRIPQGAYYFATNNQFYRAARIDIPMQGFRAYLLANTESNARNLIFRVDETTGITDILPNSVTAVTENRDIYDLNGRKVKTPAHGVYVVGSKKIFVK